ncbi:uncharacterized protein MYCGRDRAFT_97815 [Zymoseptoria tritici IPO323]|uniref:Uncharacterized protein n=1 Tax=Zymoseptoria tritici (strain CBS 115943 / IPO323) TaxID=336722 RepID=F9XRG4_ZYMTI|nr:uncharacterized protein MYCGRDRAFT_97815 [Zymoseptoria tritici IPO323]EGP82131.1 hypothetical protein MYCGRDRAFT_97815 [Zymoseptoria tritici IPO323]
MSNVSTPRNHKMKKSTNEFGFERTPSNWSAVPTLVEWVKMLFLAYGQNQSERGENGILRKQGLGRRRSRITSMEDDPRFLLTAADSDDDLPPVTDLLRDHPRLDAFEG